MTGETTITLIGNLTSDPELRFTPAGAAVANFTIASTPRTFDRHTSEFKDGDTLFLRSSVWRETAEHAAASLTKGTRVIASGILKPRTYETKTKETRTVIEFEIEEIGASLRYTDLSINRTQSKTTRTPEPINEETSTSAGTHMPAPVMVDEFPPGDPWFGQTANPSGRITPSS